MPRNSVMKEAMNAAGLVVVNPELEERARKLRSKFSRRVPAPPELTTVKAPEPITEQPRLELAPTLPQEPPKPPAIDIQPVPALPVKPALPPDLAWLGDPGPFGDNLTAMVNKCRDAKSGLVFSLEQARRREQEKQSAFDHAKAELDAVKVTVESIRCQIAGIDDTISVCSLIADQSKGINALTLRAPSSQAKSHTPRNSPCACKRTDILSIMETGLDRAWSAADLLDSLPEEKRGHAKGIIHVMLSTLYQEGKLARESKGRYCIRS